MNYLRAYKEMRDGVFIDEKTFHGLSTGEIPNKVRELLKELRTTSEINPELIYSTLRLMTELAFCKEALKMTVRANKIPDANVPDRIYVQIRGAVPISKGKRVWVGHYIGKQEEVCDKEGNILPEKMKEGREAVVRKVIERLRDMG